MITQGLVLRRAAAFGLLATVLAVAPAARAQSAPGAVTGAAVEAPAPPELSAAAITMRTALETRLGRDSNALANYAARAFEPVWLAADGTPNAKAKRLVATLEQAGEHALPAAKYLPDTLRERLVVGGPALEADLTAAFLDYARDVGSGLLEPRRIDRELNVFPLRPDAGELIQKAARTADLAALFDRLPPQGEDYRRLLERYAVFRARAGKDLWGPPVRRGRTLRPGNRHGRVAEARARLIAIGDLNPEVYASQTVATDDGTRIAAADVTTDVAPQAFEPELFDEPMVAALQRFQARHGLNRDGVIGPATLGQLNVSPATRAEQIAVNLERLRWMNHDLGARHIVVNLAGFTMAVIEDGKPVFTSRVIVGKARKHRTPEFTEMMTHMIVNPSWNVPNSIATEEILPILQKDPTYLERKNMRIVGADTDTDTDTVDWATVTAAEFPGRIVQNPGAGNALGTVKFMFPNKYSIYLHDTPSRRLFSRDVRAYSHGCVRVEKPHEFAAYLLSGQVENPAEYFERLLASGRERWVDLDRPLPVYLTYRSAWIDGDGVAQFRGDVYRRDRRVSRAMIKAGVTILQ